MTFYVHPRDIDPEHSRLPIGTVRRFKCTVNLGKTQEKIRRLTSEFGFTTLESFFNENGEALRN